MGVSPQELRVYIMISERMHKPDKLAAICIGDTIRFMSNGELTSGRVAGWHWRPDGHYALVKSGDQQVKLSQIVSRDRESGLDSGTVTF
jgi:hypothetical protein